MPLVVICGIPSSGKTTRAVEIQKHIQEVNPEIVVHLISEDTLNIDPNLGYKDSIQEKNLRGTLKAATERHLGRDTVVILDSLNYIKGYRYELYCITRALVTPHCVVHCDTTREQAKQWNKRYTEVLQDDLASRFELPNPKNRWDKPLFSLRPEEVTPLDAIHEALFSRKAPPPNSATIPAVLAAPNYLHELDKLTGDVINSLLEAQKICLPGDTISLPGTTQKFHLKRPLNLSELRRLRRQFIKVSQLHPPPTEAIVEAFVNFLNASF